MGWFSWIFDNVPWWVYPLIGSMGIGTLLALFPPALTFIIGIYNLMPVWLRWITGAAIVAWLAHVAGRNIGRRNARADQERLDERARKQAKEVTREIEQLDPTDVDKRLEESGGFWDDDPKPRDKGRRP